MEALQARLRELGFYTGALNGEFDGGTESAIKTFQSSVSLNPDGRVGPSTRKKLFPGQPPPPAPPNPLATAPVGQRCLALTATFETNSLPPGCFAGITGDFDGQGLSFGALQWNIGQGSLQPLLLKFISRHPTLADNLFHEQTADFQKLLRQPIPAQLAFCKTIQTQRFQVIEPWRGTLIALGRSPEFQQIQSDAAGDVLVRAKAMCVDFGLKSQRALALMFDIITQNGSISQNVRSQIRSDFSSLPPTAGEPERMKIIAERRAAVARAEFRNDVLSRKLCIANGSGRVHGLDLDLAAQFALTLDPA